MLTALTRQWWAVVLRGVLAVLFGVLALAWPGITVKVLVLFFGAYALVDGIFALTAAIRGVGSRPRWLLGLEAVAGIGIGIVTFFWPSITALVLLVVIAVHALITGVFEIVAAIALRRELKGEWLLALGGVLSVLFGLALLIWPTAGIIAVIWLVGAFAIVFGIVLIALGLRLRHIAHQPPTALLA